MVHRFSRPIILYIQTFLDHLPFFFCFHFRQKISNPIIPKIIAQDPTTAAAMIIYNLLMPEFSEVGIADNAGARVVGMVVLSARKYNFI